MTALHEEYLRRCAKHTDINVLLPVLYELAKECQTIVEFGVRGGESTIAFLAGLEESQQSRTTLLSYDIGMPAKELIDFMGQELYSGKLRVDWLMQVADTSKPLPDDASWKIIQKRGFDLLFLDTLHTDFQIRCELVYGNLARKYIVAHDTVTNRDIGENGQPGIWQPIMDFIAANPHWKIKKHYEESNGLLVLERNAK